MNTRRIALAALVAWIVDSVYGFVVFGLLLNGQFAKYPGVFRSFEAVSSMLPQMFAASLLAFLAVAYIFAKGHDGGPGLQEGLRFGLVFATYGLFGISIPTYAIYNIGPTIAIQTAFCAFIEMLLAGVVLGLVYKPSAAAKPVGRAVGV